MHDLLKDEKSFAVVVRAILAVTPGFLVIGYFEPGLFMQLDALKLLMLSVAFNLVFAAPFFIAAGCLKSNSLDSQPHAIIYQNWIVFLVILIEVVMLISTDYFTLHGSSVRELIYVLFLLNYVGVVLLCANEVIAAKLESQTHKGARSLIVYKAGVWVCAIITLLASAGIWVL